METEAFKRRILQALFGFCCAFVALLLVDQYWLADEVSVKGMPESVLQVPTS